MWKIIPPSILFFLLSFLCVNVSTAQDTLPFTDSLSFFQFLQSQEEIPSLQFRYTFLGQKDDEDLLKDSTFQFSVLEDGKVVSKTYIDFESWYDAGKNYYLSDSSNLQSEFLIYQQSSDLEAAKDYVLSLWKNKDLLQKEPEPGIGNGLVLLANLVPFKPLVEHKIHFFSDFKLVIIINLIGFFLFLAISMLLLMIYVKTSHTKIETAKKKYQDQIIGPLSEILFEKSDEEIRNFTQEEIYSIFPEKDFKKKYFKEVFIENLISLNKKMKGDFKIKLKSIYRRLELDKISMNSLRSNKWDVVTRGLVQINEMDLIEALPQVRELTDSSNFYIRSQSIATVMNLSDNVNLSTLKKQSYPLSNWQQMNYLRIIKYLNHQNPLNIDTLFESKNQSIRLFGYKLVRMLGRIDLLAKLSEIAPEVEDLEKIEILKTYQIIGIHNEAHFINQCLRSDNVNLVIAAANAAGSIGDQVSVHILIELLNENPNFSLKMVYLQNLMKLDPAVCQNFISSKSDSEMDQINSHLLDPLLQHV